MHPSIKRAYETGTHPLSKHPVHGVYGKELANDQYENIKGQYRQSTGSEHLNMMEITQLLQRITQREAAHKEQLEQLAKRLVASLWKADPNMFEADLGSSGQTVEEYEAETEAEEEDDSPLTPDEQKQVHKRVTLNTLSHGAAIHQMTTLHHMVKDALDKLDPALMPAYDKLARGAVYSSWFMSIEQIVNMAGQKGGDVHVDWGEQEAPPEEEMPAEEPQEEKGPKVKATGLIFPILVHELAKGCMEVLTAHGLPQDEQTLKKVYKHADRWDQEIFHFFVGPALWRKFIKVVDRTKLPETIAALSKLDPDDLHSVVKSIVENPAEAQERLAELVKDPEGYEPTERIKRIAKMLEEEEEAELKELEAAEPKTLPKPATPIAPTKPDKKSEPYKPPKPAVIPKRKAGY